jgi:predicted nucleotidyltransferase
LSIVRDEGRLFHLPAVERDAVVGALREFLQAQSDVVFAYLHGSFAAKRAFRDVDVAVYLGPPRSLEEGGEHAGLRAMALGAEAEAALRRVLEREPPPVDVRALNQAPLGFCYQALRGGSLLVSGDEAFRVEWAARIVWQYLDLKPLRERALKEAMSA